MRRSVLKKMLGIMIAALFVLLAGCSSAGSTASSGDGSLQKVLDSGELILGLDSEFPPMGFVDKSGEIVGFDIDVAQEVCDRLGVTLVKKAIIWSEKEEDLNNGTIDCIWSGMSVTPERREAMNLSEPYMKNEFIFLLLGNSAVSELNDLKGRTIGTQEGSTAHDALMASALYSEAEIRLFNDNVELLETLEKGLLDAALVDSVVAYYFVNSRSESYFILPNSFGEDEYAIGFRKEDQTLRDKVQETLGEMKADGSLGEISRKWFGSDITIIK
ncbi:MAG: amino acid ABC transporter substrate-binding protein [Oscillospiraceae bacterium]|nr:amino acid ABC transporter substrate-binding protein [Oscillospiraceae bacterium]